MKTLLRIPLLFLFLLCALQVTAQTPRIFWLSITDSIDHIETFGATYVPVFTDPAVQNTFAPLGNSISFEQAMP